MRVIGNVLILDPIELISERSIPAILQRLDSSSITAIEFTSRIEDVAAIQLVDSLTKFAAFLEKVNGVYVSFRWSCSKNLIHHEVSKLYGSGADVDKGTAIYHNFAFLNDNTIVALGADGVLRKYDISGKYIKKSSNHQNYIYSDRHKKLTKTMVDGREFLACQDSKYRICLVDIDLESIRYIGKTDEVYVINALSTGDIAVLTNDKSIRIFDSHIESQNNEGVKVMENCYCGAWLSADYYKNFAVLVDDAIVAVDKDTYKLKISRKNDYSGVWQTTSHSSFGFPMCIEPLSNGKFIVQDDNHNLCVYFNNGRKEVCLSDDVCHGNAWNTIAAYGDIIAFTKQSSRSQVQIFSLKGQFDTVSIDCEFRAEFLAFTQNGNLFVGDSKKGFKIVTLNQYQLNIEEFLIAVHQKLLEHKWPIIKLYEIAEVLEEELPFQKDVTWGLGEYNVLPGGNSWIIKGGGVQGKLSNPYATIFDKVFSNAKRGIDIMSLYGVDQNGTIWSALKSALKNIRDIRVRIFLGVDLNTLMKEENFEKEVISLVKSLTVPKSNNHIYVALSWIRKDKELFIPTTGWNHAKLIVVDALTVVSGGMNLNEESFKTDSTTVYDLSIEIKGSAAGCAQRFIDEHWKDLDKMIDRQLKSSDEIFLCKGRKVYYSRETNDIWPSEYLILGSNISEFSNAFNFKLDTNLSRYRALPEGLWNMKIMGVGKRSGFSGREASDIALPALINKAQKSLLLSQQSLFQCDGYNFEYNQDIVLAICHALLQGAEVKILISMYASENNDYPSPSAKYTKEKILYNLSKLYSVQQYKLLQLPDKPTSSTTTQLATTHIREDIVSDCEKRLEVAHVGDKVIRDGDDKRISPPQYMRRNHAKVIIVDGEMAYIGSHNLYPTYIDCVLELFKPYCTTYLGEYGFIITNDDSYRKVEELIRFYWEPLWNDRIPLVNNILPALHTGHDLRIVSESPLVSWHYKCKAHEIIVYGNQRSSKEEAEEDLRKHEEVWHNKKHVNMSRKVERFILT